MKTTHSSETGWTHFHDDAPPIPGGYRVQYFDDQEALAHWTGDSWIDHADPKERKIDTHQLTQMVKAWRSAE